jgi:hypothetical protein
MALSNGWKSIVEKLTGQQWKRLQKNKRLIKSIYDQTIVAIRFTRNGDY